MKFLGSDEIIWSKKNSGTKDLFCSEKIALQNIDLTENVKERGSEENCGSRNISVGKDFL